MAGCPSSCLLANQRTRAEFHGAHLKCLVGHLILANRFDQRTSVPNQIQSENLEGLAVSCFGSQGSPATCTERPCRVENPLKRRDDVGTSFASVSCINSEKLWLRTRFAFHLRDCKARNSLANECPSVGHWDQQTISFAFHGVDVLTWMEL